MNREALKNQIAQIFNKLSDAEIPFSQLDEVRERIVNLCIVTLEKENQVSRKWNEEINDLIRQRDRMRALIESAWYDGYEVGQGDVPFTNFADFAKSNNL